MKKDTLFMALILFVVLMVSRLVPHPANFTALSAVGLFAGSLWQRSSLSFLIPLLAIFVTDLILGMYPGAGFTYAAVALGVMVAPRLLASVWRVGLSALMASVIFFVVSNLGVWFSSGMYPQTVTGLAECYLYAVPFFQNTLLSTMFYSVFMFAIYRLAFAPNGFEGFFKLSYGRYQR